MKAAIYCRVSREEQSLEQQEEALIKYCFEQGWDYIVFKEKISGAKASRFELDNLMQGVRNKEFQIVMVTKLDRLGRSLKHLINLVEEFNNKGIQFVCLNPQIDTKTSTGMFFLQIIGAVAELERAMIIERTKTKLDYLKSQGQRLGRPVGKKDTKPRRKSGYWLRYANKSPPNK